MARPKYRSDAGRVVYGGGGITPDVTRRVGHGDDGRARVSPRRGAQRQAITGVLHNYALELKTSVRPDFNCPGGLADRAESSSCGSCAPIDPRHAQGAARFYRRELEHQVARAAFVMWARSAASCPTTGI